MESPLDQQEPAHGGLRRQGAGSARQSWRVPGPAGVYLPGSSWRTRRAPSWICSPLASSRSPTWCRGRGEGPAAPPPRAPSPARPHSPQPRQAALAALPAPPVPRPASPSLAVRLPPRTVTKGPAPRPARLLTHSWPREGNGSTPSPAALLCWRSPCRVSGKVGGNANSSRVTNTGSVFYSGSRGATVIKPKVGV